MHILPLEIQHNIFFLACTDGGRTGLALSLTSRSYCDAVRPVRLHSVAVRAFSDIEGILQSYKRDEAELEASGSTLKTQVRHLLLSPEPNNADEDEKPDEDEDSHTASMVALLQLVGPTLRTLTYTAQIRFTGLRGICPMPKLEELTVFLNPAERQSESQPLTGPAHRPASYPALRKLHIILLPEAVVPDLPGSWWAEAAPNVTDIRLTNVGRRDGGRGWVVSMIDGDRTKRPYPSVRRMFVKPYQRPIEGNSRKCSSLRAQDGYYVRRLEKLKERVPEDIQFVLLEGRGSKGPPLNRIADVEQYWMDDADGGPGGWQRSDEATAGGGLV